MLKYILHAIKKQSIKQIFRFIKETLNIGLLFCIKGGHGINGDGVTISDPEIFLSNKPDVNKDCTLNPEALTSVGIT